MNKLINKAKPTPEYMPSIYGNTPEMRAYDYPGMCSVELRDLFPELPVGKYVNDGDDLSFMITDTRAALEKVDMSMIRPDTSVNIVCAEHGFVIFGGKPYIEMLKTIKAVVEERTGCRDIRLRVVMYRTPMEGQEVLEYYHLKEEFGEEVEYVGAFGKAVPIETKIGTLYGLEKAYDADKFIYAYYDDPRELYAMRLYRKSFKAFTMNLARFETRSVFHEGMGDFTGTGSVRSIVPTSIYDSDFIQQRFAFACFMVSAPTGLTGVDADNDLYAYDDRSMQHILRDYALVYQLYRHLDDFTAIIDGGRWAHYMHAGGIIAGAVTLGGFQDFMDLNAKTELRPPTLGAPGLKCIIFNQVWEGITNTAIGASYQTFVVGEELRRMFEYDPTNNSMFSRLLKPVDTLKEGIEKCREINGNDRFLIFDGSFGFINCSEEMAEELIARAPEISRLVKEELYPKYMKQRGLEGIY